jgi:hypothetical protein
MKTPRTPKSSKRKRTTDVKSAAVNTPTYEQRVRALEEEGLTRSDAQGVVDAEDKKELAPRTAVEKTTLPLTAQQIVDQPEVERTTRGTAVASGFAYNKLAGKPTKQAVIAVFGQNGYSAYSWVSRAAKLGITPEELCEKFVADPKAVKELWQKATIKS